jgi:hypothetical protein
MIKPHKGILIDKIPVDGFGGLVFAVGTMVIFMIGIPEIRQFSILALPLGLLVAGGLYYWRSQTRW